MQPGMRMRVHGCVGCMAYVHGGRAQHHASRPRLARFTCWSGPLHTLTRYRDPGLRKMGIRQPSLRGRGLGGNKG